MHGQVIYLFIPDRITYVHTWRVSTYKLFNRRFVACCKFSFPFLYVLGGGGGNSCILLTLGNINIYGSNKRMGTTSLMAFLNTEMHPHRPEMGTARICSDICDRPSEDSCWSAAEESFRKFLSPPPPIDHSGCTSVCRVATLVERRLRVSCTRRLALVKDASEGV